VVLGPTYSKNVGDGGLAPRVGIQGSSYALLERQKHNMSLKERWTERLECMHAEENKIDDINHMKTLIELKKSINLKPNIKIKS
jgi:hypothetical protein